MRNSSTRDFFHLLLCFSIFTPIFGLAQDGKMRAYVPACTFTKADLQMRIFLKSFNFLFEEEFEGEFGLFVNIFI